MINKNSTKPWTIKYAPKKASEVVGQSKAVLSLKKFLVNFKQERFRGMMLFGPSGVGKTSSVYALASEMDLEVVELNASDFRNKDGISSIVGAASKQMSLFSKGKIILIDEIDGVSGTKDRGGIPELMRIIEGTAFPIVLTVNDPYNKKFSAIRKKTTLVELDPVSVNDTFELLLKIAKEENIEYDETTLKSLARRSGGDVRASLNDFQITSAGGKLTRETLDALSDREFREELNTALMKVFKTTDPLIAKNSFMNIKEDLNECMMWIDENLPKEYDKPADLARAYNYISKADIMNRRIRRWQHWRFMVYINDYLSAGVAVSKDEKYKKMITFKQSERPLKIWMANRKYMQRVAICEKIADKTHSSKKDVLISTYPFVKEMFRRGDKTLIEGLTNEFEFDSGEVAHLRK